MLCNLLTQVSQVTRRLRSSHSEGEGNDCTWDGLTTALMAP